MKRRTKRATARAAKKLRKESEITRPSGKSRYGQKNRLAEIARGHSRRPTSPFYLPPGQRGEGEASS